MLAGYKWLAVGAAAVLWMCGSAAAREVIVYQLAGHLAERCAAPDQTIDKALCFWMVSGALEVIANNPAYGFSVCLPHLFTVGKAVDVTRKWLDAHPEQDLRPASYAIAAALGDAYPCKK